MPSSSYGDFEACVNLLQACFILAHLSWQICCKLKLREAGRNRPYNFYTSGADFGRLLFEMGEKAVGRVVIKGTLRGEMKGLPFISPTTRSEGNGPDESIPPIN
ncbi:hypothetical protein AVEN_11366-1 [Araneus ventricosus]|uniref:Uncharacterized protein n=1 Tax=Araneus ventricosus TaxID=182803 RepID=A0A4Y2HCA9_ARAVE|nr:hypothetical protein AVEN_11366-1 [Araneus ventricosus]